MYYGVDMVKTGENISRLRQEAGLSAKDIQEVMGFTSTVAVYKWERGKTLPAIENLMALCQLFNVKMEEILVWTRPPPTNNFSLSRPAANHWFDDGVG